MQAINMEPPWKSGKIVSNRGWICLKLSNLPESVPILCVVELIELPFVPRTTEAQETLGPKPRTMVLCLRRAHGWVFICQHVWFQCIAEWLRIQLCSRADHASVYCLQAQPLIYEQNILLHVKAWKSLVHFLNYFKVQIHHLGDVFPLHFRASNVNQILPFTRA